MTQLAGPDERLPNDVAEQFKPCWMLTTYGKGITGKQSILALESRGCEAKASSLRGIYPAYDGVVVEQLPGPWL